MGSADNMIIEDLRAEQDALAAAVSVLQHIQAQAQARESKSIVILTQGLYSGENPVSGALLGLIKKLH